MFVFIPNYRTDYSPAGYALQRANKARDICMHDAHLSHICRTLVIQKLQNAQQDTALDT